MQSVKAPYLFIRVWRHLVNAGSYDDADNNAGRIVKRQLLFGHYWHKELLFLFLPFLQRHAKTMDLKNRL